MAGPPGSSARERSRRDGRLLVLGASARALAESACRSLEARKRFPGGLLAIDYFGDTDLATSPVRGAGERRSRVTVIGVRRDLGLPRAAVSLVRSALASEWSSFAYTGGLENHPAWVRLLGRSRSPEESTTTILGNDARTLAAVRDPRRLFTFLQQRDIPHAAVRCEAPQDGAGRWLVKRIRSAGGAGVREALPGAPPPPGCFFQQWLEGMIGSAAFLADGNEATLLGVTEQLTGWTALGASGYRYAGNIAGPWSAFLSVEALQRIGRAAEEITVSFGLRGLNGLDYVLHRDRPHLIEVNPRWTASMELIEERTGRNFFDLHLQGLDDGGRRAGRLPLPSGPRGMVSRGDFLAKGILYAADACNAPEPAALLALGARDRPPAGERIEAGHPICTLVVRGESPAACRSRLEASADAVRSMLRPA